MAKVVARTPDVLFCPVQTDLLLKSSATIACSTLILAVDFSRTVAVLQSEACLDGTAMPQPCMAHATVTAGHLQLWMQQ